jgi:hypothetical protein
MENDLPMLSFPHRERLAQVAKRQLREIKRRLDSILQESRQYSDCHL